MVTRSQSWFDAEKLLGGESLIRQAPARLRTPAAPPGWWEGTLVLTSDRLFFLSFVQNPLVDTEAAYWLADLEATEAGRNRVRVYPRGNRGASVTFQMLGSRLDPQGILGERGKAWLHELIRAQLRARPSYTFDLPAAPRRAAAG
ncbi:MAG: hypothetical protein WEB52_15175 [Dehalococcoidia bacterium]